MLKIRFPYIFLLMLFLSCNQNNDKNRIAEKIVIPDNLYPSIMTAIATHDDWTRKHYPKRIAAFKKNPLETNDIVFLGNSITEHGEDWSKRVKNSKAKNRGIAGDTTNGVLERLEEIIYYKPQKVFLLIGINDLYRDDISAESVYRNILEIVDTIHKKNPHTALFIQTVLPTTTDYLIEKIKDLNALLEKSEVSKPYEIIRLHEHFTLANGKMNMDFSTDGVHLNEKGYEVWSKILIEIL